MRKRFVLCGLIVAMLMSVVGTGAQERQGTCPLTNLPACRKKAQSAVKGPQAAMARLCCNLNCSEPGNTGFSVSSNFPTPQNLPARSFLLIHSSSYPETKPSWSPNEQALALNPKYIQHLALLI